MSTSKTLGIHQAGPTVTNIIDTRAFFVETLGFSQIGEVPDYPAVFLSDGTVMLTLGQAADPATATPFDPKKNIGLHRLRLDGADGATLEAMHADLSKPRDVVGAFLPKNLHQGSPRPMMGAVHGGIRRELIALAA